MLCLQYFPVVLWSVLWLTEWLWRNNWTTLRTIAHSSHTGWQQYKSSFLSYHWRAMDWDLLALISTTVQDRWVHMLDDNSTSPYSYHWVMQHITEHTQWHRKWQERPTIQNINLSWQQDINTTTARRRTDILTRDKPHWRCVYKHESAPSKWF